MHAFMMDSLHESDDEMKKGRDYTSSLHTLSLSTRKSTLCNIYSKTPMDFNDFHGTTDSREERRKRRNEEQINEDINEMRTKYYGKVIQK